MCSSRISRFVPDKLSARDLTRNPSRACLGRRLRVIGVLIIAESLSGVRHLVFMIIDDVNDAHTALQDLKNFLATLVTIADEESAASRQHLTSGLVHRLRVRRFLRSFHFATSRCRQVLARRRLTSDL